MALIKFLKPRNKLEEGGRCEAVVQQDEGEPEKKCPNCHKEIPVSRLWSNNLVCACGYHFRMRARQRIRMIADDGTFHELYRDVKAGNPLDFPGYKEKIDTVRAASGETEAVVCGTALVGGQKCALFVMDSNFMMGSMGSVVGEKITRAVETATRKKLPVIIFTTSGGARMQEGILSLMQMAKVSEALGRHDDAGLLYITVLTDPTTGGVTASFAMLGDIILAEPKALIGFAGQRVIKGTIHQELPEGFQRAEFQVEHGFVDRIVHRRKLRQELGLLLAMHSKKEVSES